MTTDASTGQGDGFPRLSEADAAALDALIEAGGIVSDVPGHLQDRARAVRELLSELDSASVGGRDFRVQRLLEAVARVGLESDAGSRLSGDDIEALDAWVLAGYDTGRVPASLRDRATTLGAMSDLLTDSRTPVATSAQRESLIDGTMDALAATVAAQESGYSFPAIPARNRWADLLSVAAVMLIAVSLLWPVMSSVRDNSWRGACDSHLRSVGLAMGQYTGDHDQTLPVVSAGFGGGTWWNVGRDPRQSNSANLYTLIREGYETLESFACPGNPRTPTTATSPGARDWSSIEEISYSYRVMARPEKELWGTPSRLVVLSDRSPVILRAINGKTIYPFESSPNHGRRGQHALTADGASQWLESPVLESGDNIWLPKSIEILIDFVSRRAGFDPLKGTEAPADRDDSFVGP